MVWSHYVELVRELSLREIKARYKQSVLGYAWVILNPLFQMLVMAFVFSHIMRFPTIGTPYTLFLYAGLLPWTLFANSVNSATNSLVQSAPLLKKIYFPREIFVLSTLLAKIVDFLLASTVFILFMVYYQQPISLHILWLIPIFLIQILFTYGLSLILAAVNLFYRDIQYILNLILTIWMYLTPVIYLTEVFPAQYRFIFQLNPLAVIINAYRQVILNGSAPNFSSLAIALAVSGILTLAGRRLFKKLEGVFADVV
jgi:ABC-type polysaccharide/polyol phosphate export permease